MVNHILSDFKCKFNSTTCNSNQKWNNDKCQCECKRYHPSKKDYAWNPSKCICEYCPSIGDDSVIVCGEIVSAIDSVSTILTKNMPKNVLSTVPINSYDKKITREKSNFLIHTISLVVICLLLLAVISISCCYYYKRD